MPDLSALVSALAIGLLLLVMLGFAFGTQRNISRGNAVMRWLQGGLPQVGRRATVRWLGSSVLEVTVAEPVEPFREAKVLVVLEPRDVGLLWAFARIRGRRDFMIVRASLRRAPGREVEAGDRASWAGSAALERVRERLSDARPSDAHLSDAHLSDARGWRDAGWQEPGGRAIEAAVGPGVDAGLARRLWDRLEQTGARVLRLTVQQTVPHLEIHVRHPGATLAADRFIAAVREIGEEVAAPR